MDLARAVLSHHKPVVLVLLHGGPLAIPELAKSVPAILDGFYLGEETGTAVAEVLFGDVSPAGRLPVSVPRQVGAIPAYYNYKPSGRRLYLAEEPGPLWPFGFGLSYSQFPLRQAGGDAGAHHARRQDDRVGHRHQHRQAGRRRGGPALHPRRGQLGDPSDF